MTDVPAARHVIPPEEQQPTVLGLSGAYSILLMSPGVATMLDFLSVSARESMLRAVAATLVGITSDDDPDRIWGRVDSALREHPLASLFPRAWRDHVCHAAMEQFTTTWRPLVDRLAATHDPL